MTTSPTQEQIARAIWSIRREDEDRCDMELEDMGKLHSVWTEAAAVCAALAASEVQGVLASPTSDTVAIGQRDAAYATFDRMIENINRAPNEPLDPQRLIAWLVSQGVHERATRASEAAPKGRVHVPMLMTRAMREVVESEEWQWEDVLAAAGAVTEDEYNAIADAVLGTRVIEAAPVATEAPHTDDMAVDTFARVMKNKMEASRAKGRGGWEAVDPDDLSRMLREHVEKSDPIDVANLCMMLWHLDAAISPSQAAPVAVGDAKSADVQAILSDAALQKFLNDNGDDKDQGLDLYYKDAVRDGFYHARGLISAHLLASQAAPDTATTAYNPEFVRNKFADYETQILNLREELAARGASQAVPVTQDAHAGATGEKFSSWEQGVSAELWNVADKCGFDTFRATVVGFLRAPQAAPSAPDAQQSSEPVDYDRVVSICDAHGICLPVDCVEMVVEIIRHAVPDAAKGDQS